MISRRPVLVIEDDSDLGPAVREVIADQGYDVLLIARGSDALRELRAGLVPSVVLLDLRLPDVDGYELWETIRAEGFAARTPFYIFSASTRLDEARLQGTAGVLKKPVDIDQLFEIIRVACRGEEVTASPTNSGQVGDTGMPLTRPHPRDFTVDIKQRADGTWRIQITEMAAYWGEGSELGDALDALRKRAVPSVSIKGVPDAETLGGAAAAFAAESAVEKYIDAEQTGDVADDAVSWDDVSVISFRRKPPPTSGSSGESS